VQTVDTIRVGETIRESPDEGAPYSPLRGKDETREVESSRFFATAKNGALHPLDDAALESDAIYLVEVRRADVVPGTSFLRRMVARGGPDDLPADFAERHDHYRHRTGGR